MKMKSILNMNLERKWIKQIRKQQECYEMQENLIRMVSKTGKHRKYLRQELDKLVESGVLLRSTMRRAIIGRYSTIYCVKEDTAASIE